MLENSYLNHSLLTKFKKSNLFNLITSFITGTYLAFFHISAANAIVNNLPQMELKNSNIRITKQLNAFDDRWFDAFNTKNVPALYEFYDKNSIMVHFPYDKNANLLGVDQIAASYQNGPFTFLDNPNLTAEFFLESVVDNMALQLKSWNVAHSQGNFSGLVFKVVHYQNGKWTRAIDLVVNDLTSLDQLAAYEGKQAYADPNFYDQSIFDYPTKRIDADTHLSYQPLESQAIATRPIVTIPNEANGYGLQVSTVYTSNGNYITFNAIKNIDGEYKVVIQSRKKLALKTQATANLST